MRGFTWRVAPLARARAASGAARVREVGLAGLALETVCAQTCVEPNRDRKRRARWRHGRRTRGVMGGWARIAAVNSTRSVQQA
jgi:hypothetical protein